MQGPRPSSSAAPSIWYADVAAPNLKCGGNPEIAASITRFSAVGETRLLSLFSIEVTPCAVATRSPRAEFARAMVVFPRLISGCQPAAGKSGGGESAFEMNVFTHDLPDQTAHVVFQHENDRALVDA